MGRTIVIAEEFSDAPGARFYTDGDKSGQEFLETILKEAFVEAKKKGEKLTVDFEGIWGGASSFLSGSFGLLAKEFGVQEVLDILILKADNNPVKITQTKDAIKRRGERQKK